MSKHNPINRADAVRYQVEDDLTVLVAVYTQGDNKAVFNQIELIKSRLEVLNPYNHSSEALNKQQ